ncbi:MAG: hypothetical protein U0353_25370 [Sandaracinus sp.]
MVSANEDSLPRGLRERLAALVPGGRVVSVRVLGTGDEESAGETHKAIGYGRPIRVQLEAASGRHDLVLHTASPNAFGHDRRSDRVAEMLLAWDSFSRIPRHVEAVDVGVIEADGSLVSLASSGEAYHLLSCAGPTLLVCTSCVVVRDGL